MATTWTAVVVTAPHDVAEGIASFLIDLGAPGLLTEDHDGSVRLTAHFPDEPPLAALERFCAHLAELFPGTRPPDIQLRTVADDGWAENWKAHFQPLRIGDRLFVHPPWVREVPPGRVPIVIDPGMAFGTGHHASTRGCLVLLERAMAGEGAARVLDLGTGSGILAIAAAKLGATDVWAVDVDPDARRVAAKNVSINGVAARVRVGGALDAGPGAFDLLLANLFARQLAEWAPRIAARLRPGGLAIGAGILAEETATVMRAWEQAGLAPHARHAEAGWTALACRRAP